MPSLATIAVDLVLNAGEFITGFDHAAVASKKFRSQLGESLEGLGGVVSGLAGQFGEFGEVLGGTVERAASSAASAIATFGKLGGVVGTLAGVGAGAAAAILAIDAGAIGLAIHTAQSAAKLGELSERAGVTTQFLAGLGVAGRGVGVDTETLTGALEKFNAAVVKAAIAPEGTKTAFKRLGIEVRDSGGNIRDTGQLFLETVQKMSSLPQPEEGFFAKQFFGKGGSAIIPLINLGFDTIKQKMEEAKSFGLGDPEAVASARKFKETVAELQDAFEGAALRLTKDLLPGLQFVADKAKAAFETGRLQAFVDKIADIVKETAVLAYALAHLGDLKIGGQALAGFIELKEGGGLEAEKARLAFLKTQRLLGSYPALDEEIQKTEQSIRVGSQKLAREVNAALTGINYDQYQKDLEGFRKGVLQNKLPFPTTFGDFDYLHEKPLTKPKGDADLAPTEKNAVLNRIRERIKALKDEQAGYENIAKAGTQAEILIAEAVKKGTEEQAKTKDLAARDKTGKAAKELLGSDQLANIVGAESVLSGFTKGLTNDLDKQHEKLVEQGAAIHNLGNAYAQGGAAIAAAALDKQFAEQYAKLNVLEELIPLASQKWGAASPIVAFLTSKLQALNAQLETNKGQLGSNLSDDLTKSLQDEAAIQNSAAPSVLGLNNAFLEGEDAVRQARIELELYNFTQREAEKGIKVTKDQIDAKRAILTEADQEAYDGALKQEAARFDIGLMYDNEITKLLRIKEVMEQSGRSSLLVDAALFDAQNQLIHQWDEAAAKVGSFGQRFHAVINEIILDGQNAGKKIFEAILSAYDGLTTQLAKLVTGQKTNFKGVFQGLAESIAKAEIQKGIGGILEKTIGVKLPGLEGKPDGSASKPFHVLLGGGHGYSLPADANIPIFGKKAGGIGGLLGKVLGGVSDAGNDTNQAADGSRTNPFYVITLADASAAGLGRGFSFGLGGGGGIGGSGGGFSLPSDANIPIFGKPHGGSSGSSTASTLFGSIFGGLGKSILGGIGNLDEQGTSSFWEQFLNFFSGAFGGAKAGGGDMRPGRWYLTGEKGPEIISPSSDATVTPLSKLTGGKQANISMPLHFHGFKDNDMFRKSENQIAQHVHRQAQIAYSRAF